MIRAPVMRGTWARQLCSAPELTSSCCSCPRTPGQERPSDRRPVNRDVLDVRFPHKAQRASPAVIGIHMLPARSSDGGSNAQQGDGAGPRRSPPLEPRTVGGGMMPGNVTTRDTIAERGVGSLRVRVSAVAARAGTVASSSSSSSSSRSSSSRSGGGGPHAPHGANHSTTHDLASGWGQAPVPGRGQGGAGAVAAPATPPTPRPLPAPVGRLVPSPSTFTTVTRH